MLTLGRMGSALRFLAHHGRLCLVFGLLVGIALPSVATALRPFLPEIVGCLLALTAMRIGLRQTVGELSGARDVIGLVLGLQVAAPVLAITVLNLVGQNGSLVGLAVVLMLAAPSISGSPALTLLLDHEPAPAMRLLLTGTLLLPLTIIPVLWLVPALGSLADVIQAALRLALVIAISVGLGFAVRGKLFPEPGQTVLATLDGAVALFLAILVVALMSALGPALRETPLLVLSWLAFAFLLNFGMQILAGTLRGKPDFAAVGVVAGNRNIALFLVALPAAVTDPLLVFIGCYQVPMYLTPILMRRFYARRPDPA